jgi:tetratricopeptide (TPR) repeat protein
MARYEAALKRGHSFSWDQRWPEAIKAFEQAAVAAANQPAPYAGLGMAYLETGNLEKALHNYKLAARYSNGDLIYLKHVGDVQERLGQLDEAGRTYMAMGEIQLKRRKLDEAVGNWLRAVRLEPGLVGAHQRLATVYQRQGLISNAIREYLAIARIYYSRGAPQQALKICHAALELDPRNADVHTAIDLIQQGEALPELEAGPIAATRAGAMADDEGDAGETLRRMADAMEADRLGQVLPGQVAPSSPVLDAARLAEQQLAAAFFEDSPDDRSPVGAGGRLSKLERDALISKGLDFHRRGRMDEAITLFEQAISGGESSPAARFSLGLLYQAKMRHSAAIRALQHTLQDGEYRLASHFALGDSFYATGMMDRAVEHFVGLMKLLDMETVPEAERRSLAAQYDQLRLELKSEKEPDKATEFISAARQFLTHPGWKEQVRSARVRLDSLSSGGQTFILGDILTAGSAQVLESLYLSREYARRGKFNSAFEEAYRAIELSPNYLPSHLQVAGLMANLDRTELAVAKLVTIADTYAARNDLDSAVGTYERALEIAPLDLSARRRLIALLNSSNRIDRSLEHYSALADAYYNLAQWGEVRDVYLEALKLAPQSSNGPSWRARYLRRIADIDVQRLDWRRALAAYTELSRLMPEDEEVTASLYDLYRKVGTPKRALQHLDQYLGLLAKRKQGARILSFLIALNRQHPEDAGLAYRLTRLYLLQKRIPSAIEVLDRLGDRQMGAGQSEQAAVTIERILALNPPNAADYRAALRQLRRAAN